MQYFTDYALALGRRFRALKLWFVMRYFGREGLAAILRERLIVASWLGEQIRNDQRLVLVAAPTMGLVCLRCREGDNRTKDLMKQINNSGQFFVSHTVLAGNFTIRVAIGNIRTTQQDIEELWQAITDFLNHMSGECTRVSH